MGALDIGEDVVPEGLDLVLAQSALIVHAELNRIDGGEDFEKAAQRGLRVRREIFGGDAPHQSRRALAGVLRRAWNAAALHAAAIDVVPDAGGDFDAALVRQADHGLEGRGVAGLLLRA